MIFHLFTLLFVGLKLTGFISWSWWLVLLPSYIGVAVLFAGIVFLALVKK